MLLDRFLKQPVI